MSEVTYKQIEHFEQFVITSTFIECSRCKKTKEIVCFEEIEASEAFYNEGWRATANHCYCPKCRKKYRVK